MVNERGESYEDAEREAIAFEGASQEEIAREFEDHARDILAAKREREKKEAEASTLGIDEERWRALSATPPFSTFGIAGPWQLAQQRVAKAEEPIDAVPTPFPSLNKLCMMRGGQRGLAHGWHTMVGGASNIGKTNVALALTRHAIASGERVLYFALEEDREDILTRLLAAEGGVPLARLTRGKRFDLDVERKSAARFNSLPGSLYINEDPVTDVEAIADVVREFRRNLGVRTFVVDHLQLARAGDRDRDIYDRVTAVSSGLKSVAREENVLSIALSQLNRKASNDWSRCPRIYDLLGGSSLENDTDVGLLVDHCEKHYQQEVGSKRARTRLIVGKNRHGPKGWLPIAFDWRVSRVTEVDESTGAAVVASIDEYVEGDLFEQGGGRA